MLTQNRNDFRSQAVLLNCSSIHSPSIMRCKVQAIRHLILLLWFFKQAPRCRRRKRRRVVGDARPALHRLASPLVRIDGVWRGMRSLFAALSCHKHADSHWMMRFISVLVCFFSLYDCALQLSEATPPASSSPHPNEVVAVVLQCNRLFRLSPQIVSFTATCAHTLS